MINVILKLCCTIIMFDNDDDTLYDLMTVTTLADLKKYVQ